MNRHRVLIARLLAAWLLATPAALAHTAVPARADEITQLQQQLAQEERELAAITAEMDANGQQISALQANLAQLQAVLNDLGGKLAATQARLDQNQAQLAQIQAREDAANLELAETQRKLDLRQAAFNSHMRALDKLEHTPVFAYVLTSADFSTFLRRVTDAELIIAADHELADQLKATRARVQSLRDQLDRDRRAQAQVVDQIAAQKAALAHEFALQDVARRSIAVAKAKLDARQRLLDQQQTDLGNQIIVDQSELDGLLAFSSGRIGSGGAVLPPEVMSSSWGAYYNQRDARWGNDYVGASGYQVWQIGCLLSDVAMVYTHFGFRSVTPATIALNNANFTRDGLMYNSALNVPGHPATINNSPTSAWIRDWLNSGGTVIVGMYISGGTHFVTLTGVRGASDYWMNDPWNARAMQVSFNSSNVTGPIFEAIGYR